MDFLLTKTGFTVAGDRYCELCRDFAFSVIVPKDITDLVWDPCGFIDACTLLQLALSGLHDDHRVWVQNFGPVEQEDPDDVTSSRDVYIRNVFSVDKELPYGRTVAEYRSRLIERLVRHDKTLLSKLQEGA